MPNREEAWKLLCEYTQSENLRKHALAVEACVRAYARKFGGSRSEVGGSKFEVGSRKSEDADATQNNRQDAGATAAVNEELWGVAALLHDFDYERWPNEEHHPTQGHPTEGSRILREKGYPEEMIRAILSHADYTGIARQTALEHALFACDELAGFLTACALVRPSKSILDLEVSSVKKRMKDKAFARGVNRQDVVQGAAELGVSLDEHIEFCVQAMRGVASELGLG